jgi:limonene-1,2-epoxide hydrolase
VSDDFAQNFRAAIDAFNAGDLDGLLSRYHRDVYFEDPIQRVYGLDAFAEVNRRMFRKLRGLKITLHELLVGDGQFFASWSMRFSLPLGPTITIEGATHGKLRDGKIIFHRDYWDMLSSLLETSPLLGVAYRAVATTLG